MMNPDNIDPGFGYFLDEEGFSPEDAAAVTEGAFQFIGDGGDYDDLIESLSADGDYDFEDYYHDIELEELGEILGDEDF